MRTHTRTTTKADTAGPKRAVLYLRVSTPGQVNNDYDPEGISLPAQRDACQRKARELGAEVVAEYVEPGRTATEIEKRPVFQEMIARIKAEHDVNYIIVHHFNRIFRNGIDAAITKKDLKPVGCRVVSTIVDLGDTLESQLVEGILHAVDEYQVKRSNADVKYKMGAKAKKGGTITKAPLGYLNVREQYDGREVRTVTTDPERAPHLTRGFELFATGQYTARQALDRLTAAGLRTRPTRRSPGKPLSINALYNILSHPYYCGFVEYDGERIKGRHTPLISEELFDRVQRVLALHGGGDTRERRHHHYLKGTLWCGACGKRLVVMRGKGNGGVYFYYFCRGRQDRSCHQPMVPVATLETAVARHYAGVRLSEEFCQRLRAGMQDLLLSELGSLDAMRKHLAARLEELDTRETTYVRLVGKPGWPEAKIMGELADIKRQRGEIQQQLQDTSGKLDTGRQFFLAAMELLQDPQAFYTRCGTSLKMAMNKVIFDRLYVEDGEITRHKLSETARAVVEAEQKTRPYYRRSNLPELEREAEEVAGKVMRERAEPASGSLAEALARANQDTSPFPGEEAGLSWVDDVDLLCAAALGSGLSKQVLVAGTGFEPM